MIFLQHIKHRTFDKKYQFSVDNTKGISKEFCNYYNIRHIPLLVPDDLKKDRYDRDLFRIKIRRQCTLELLEVLGKLSLNNDIYLYSSQRKGYLSHRKDIHDLFKELGYKSILN